VTNLRSTCACSERAAISTKDDGRRQTKERQVSCGRQRTGQRPTNGAEPAQTFPWKIRSNRFSCSR
jgi:hypothetical protein